MAGAGSGSRTGLDVESIRLTYMPPKCVPHSEMNSPVIFQGKENGRELTWIYPV